MRRRLQRHELEQAVGAPDPRASRALRHAERLRADDGSPAPQPTRRTRRIVTLDSDEDDSDALGTPSDSNPSDAYSPMSESSMGPSPLSPLSPISTPASPTAYAGSHVPTLRKSAHARSLRAITKLPPAIMTRRRGGDAALGSAPATPTRIEGTTGSQLARGRMQVTSPPAASLPQPAPSAMVVLRVNNREKLAIAQGDHEPPFLGVLDEKAADTTGAVPTQVEKSIFERFRPPTQPNNNTFQAKTLQIGKRRLATWYTAPYPAEYSDHSVLYLCEFCLKYMSSEFVQDRHALKCPNRAPPGNEIYRDGDISVFEVNGAHAPLYCQNLCLLAKLFLDSKTLYYDVEPFLFYVLTRVDSRGASFVGYFSKEKIFSGRAPQRTPINNVSCIVTLPVPENRGYGQFLIAFSYLLTRLQGTTGTPEKPLSSLGERSYTNYWTLTLCGELRNLHDNQLGNVSISGLSAATGMTLDDVVYGLELLGWLDRGVLRVNVADMHRRLRAYKTKRLPELNSKCLLWSPGPYL